MKSLIMFICLLLTLSELAYSEDGNWDKNFIPILDVKFERDVKTQNVQDTLQEIALLVNEKLKLNIVYEIPENHHDTTFKNKNVEIKKGHSVKALLMSIANLINCTLIYDKADKVITFEKKE